MHRWVKFYINYKKGWYLKIYSKILTEREMINLKIYHGSTFIVEQPSLEILNYRTDFAKGFYTTANIEQAKRWTKTKKLD